MTACLKHFVILSMMVTHLLCILPRAYSEESIKIGSMEHYAPYNFEGEDGKYIGIDVAIIEAVLTELDITFTHLPRPWKRAVVEFEDGDTEMLFQLTLTPERSEKWHMVGPIRPNNRGYFVKHDSPIQDITTIQDLKGFSVGIIRGYTYPKEFVNADYFTKEKVTNIKQNVWKLEMGRVDVVLENVIPFQYYARKLGFEDRIRMLPTLAQEGERYVAFQKNERGEHLSTMFQKKLDRLIANGTIQAILDTRHE